jgi:hypothetical protein
MSVAGWLMLALPLLLLLLCFDAAGATYDAHK